MYMGTHKHTRTHINTYTHTHTHTHTRVCAHTYTRARVPLGSKKSTGRGNSPNRVIPVLEGIAGVRAYS